MADVSMEFFARTVALLEEMHGPRITDQLDLEMLAHFAAYVERSWQRLPKPQVEEQTTYDFEEEIEKTSHLPVEIEQ